MNDNYIIINGIKSTTVRGLLISYLPSISKPLMRTEVTTIDGRDGDIVTNLGYSSYDKQITIGLHHEYDIDETIRYFAQSGTITFSNEPDKYYRYQMIEQIDFEKLLRWKTATVTFHVQPFKYPAEDDEVIIEQEYKTSSGTAITDAKAGDAKEVIVTVPHNQRMTALNVMLMVDGALVNTLAYDLSDHDFYGGTFNVTTGLLTFKYNSDGTEKSTPSLARLTANNITLYSSSNEIEANAVVEGGAVTTSFSVTVTYRTAMSPVITNFGNTTAKPVINIEGDGLVYLFVGGRYALTAAVEESITIDTENMEAYKGNTLMNRYVAGDYENIWLAPGRNQIAWNGDITKITFKNHSRWI